MNLRTVLHSLIAVSTIAVGVIVMLNSSGMIANATPSEHSWRVRIGDGREIKVDANDIGETLYQGDLKVEARLDASGNLSNQLVCSGFPSVQLSRVVLNTDETEKFLIMELDPELCRLTVDDIEKPDVSDVLKPVSNIIGASGSEYRKKAKGRAVLKAGDGFAFALTQTKVMLDYAPSSLNIYGSESACEVDSPAGFAGVVWHIDDCTGSLPSDYGTYIKKTTTGQYHATKNYFEYWDATEHTSSVLLKGYSSHHTIVCDWTPDGFHKKFSLYGLKTSIKCYKSG